MGGGGGGGGGGLHTLPHHLSTDEEAKCQADLTLCLPRASNPESAQESQEERQPQRRLAGPQFHSSR